MEYDNYSILHTPELQFESLVGEGKGESVGAAPGQQWLVPPGGVPAGRGPIAGPMAGRMATPFGVPGGEALAGGFPPAAMGMTATPGNGESWWADPAQMSVQPSGWNLPLDGGSRPFFNQRPHTGHDAPTGGAMNPLLQDWMHSPAIESGQAPANNFESLASRSDSVTQALEPAALTQDTARLPGVAEVQILKESLRPRVALLTREENKTAARNAIAQPLARSSVTNCSHFIDFLLLLEAGMLKTRANAAPTVHIEEFKQLQETHQGWLLDAAARRGEPITALHPACAKVLGITIRRGPSSKLMKPENAEAVKRLFHDGHRPNVRQPAREEKYFCQFLANLEKQQDCQTWDQYRLKSCAEQQRISGNMGDTAKRSATRQLKRDRFIESVSNAPSNVPHGGSETSWVHYSPAAFGPPPSEGLTNRRGRPRAKRSSVAEATETTLACNLALSRAVRVRRRQDPLDSVPRLASSSSVQRQPARPTGPIGFDARPAAQQLRAVSETSTGGTHATSLMASGEPQAYSQASISNWDGAPTQAHLLPPGGGSSENPAISIALSPQGAAAEGIDAGAVSFRSGHTASSDELFGGAARWAASASISAEGGVSSSMHESHPAQLQIAGSTPVSLENDELLQRWFDFASQAAFE
jgi:hypothetical protein